MPMLLGNLPSSELLQQIVLDTNRKQPLHVQLKTSLERLISENFDDATRFFSEAQLIENLRISQGTVRRALAELAADGLLEKKPARGSIVRKRSQKSGLRNLAVFLPEYFSSNITQILTLLNVECLNRHIHLQPFYTHRGERLIHAYRQLSFLPHEGAVVLLANSPPATTELASAFGDKGYTCIVVDTLLKSTAHKFVGVDNKAGIDLGLDHLVGLGHRTIALLVNEPEAHENVQERVNAFQAYGRSHPSLGMRVYHTGIDIWENSGVGALKVMEEIWNTQPRPTALFAVSDTGATAAIQWLQKRKIQVPEDISVLGFDGSDIGAMIHPALSSVTNPFLAMSEAIFNILDESTPEPRRVFMAPSLVIRESTSTPPA
ncbi:MAG: GntR family transcriptional regulator [Methylacidiphilales bacterium]|nr:GntR family transcriptional regulator [Candidatus Methylacidiphilales bacterium]